MRWPDGVTCLQCGGSKVSRIQTNGTERKCAHQFLATTGTILHNTHLPVDKWFAAVASMVDAGTGLCAGESFQFGRERNIHGDTPRVSAFTLTRITNIVDLGYRFDG
jgi:hypothetical protein